MRVRMRKMPDDLRENLYKIPYMRKDNKIKLLIPISIIPILLVFIFLFNPFKKTYKEFNYIGPKDGDILLPDEFSIIVNEPVEVYINKEPLKPNKYDEYYIFEKMLEEGEYKVEIIRENERREIKIYVVDISWNWSFGKWYTKI